VGHSHEPNAVEVIFSVYSSTEWAPLPYISYWFVGYVIWLSHCICTWFGPLDHYSEASKYYVWKSSIKNEWLTMFLKPR